MRSYNKGEWSELYAICSIIHNKIIKVADSNLRPTEQCITVLKLLMESIEGKAEYDITENGNGNLSIVVNGTNIKRLQVSNSTVSQLFSGIQNGAGRSFSIPIGDIIMGELLLDNFKANSHQKADLETISIMPTENRPRQIGFSVKSQVGGPSTLLNASRSTNFVYEVVGFTGDINAINDLSNPAQVMKRISAIKKAGGRFLFSDTESSSMRHNLRLTDTKLPDIMAYMILDYFSNSGVANINEIASRVIPTLPFRVSELEISSQVKNFLCNIALGMIPAQEWDGTALGGGCIFVKDDSELVCFTLYDIDQFKDYLFNNTKFDTASTTRHQFGKLYKGNDNKLYFKLNLDIRFIG